MTAVATKSGPLTTSCRLSEDLLFQSNVLAATWLALVGLRGQFAAVRGTQRWRRWDGRTWQPCDVADVNRAVRHALHAVYDRRMAQNPDAEQVMQLVRLLDVNWRLGPLMGALRRAVTVDPERLL